MSAPKILLIVIGLLLVDQIAGRILFFAVFSAPARHTPSSSLKPGTLQLGTGWQPVLDRNELYNLRHPQIVIDHAYVQREGAFGTAGRAYIVSGKLANGATVPGLDKLVGSLPRSQVIGIAQSHFQRLGANPQFAVDDIRHIAIGNAVGYAYNSRQSLAREMNWRQNRSYQPADGDHLAFELLISGNRFHMLTLRADAANRDWSSALLEQFETAIESERPVSRSP